MPTDNPNVGLAFALTCGAGAATAVGAAVVFVPRLVQYAHRKCLAAALGLSAGVLAYVAFVEIFKNSKQSFQDAGYSEKDAYIYGTLCFFGGAVVMMILHYFVSWLLRGDRRRDGHGPVDGESQKQETYTSSVSPASTAHPAATTRTTEKDDIAPCACCSDDPVKDLESLKYMANEIEHGGFQKKENHQQSQNECEPPLPEHSHEHNEHCRHEHAGDDNDEESKIGDPTNAERAPAIDDEPEMHDRRSKEERTKLMRTSINAAVAISLHNFPEGLATFVATLENPKVGAVLAIAIAIHNIPIGLCIAMPIYYATGKRWKAFGWAVLSGATGPFSAFLGWLVLASVFSNIMYAILFGMVAGMLVVVSVRELLPTAHRYDPDDSVVTYSFITGMAVMALSLILFEI